METSKYIVAKNILALRKYHEWSQATLAKKAGISQRTVSNIENPPNDPNYSPTLDNVEKIASAFGIAQYHISMPVRLEVLVDKCIEKTIECYDSAGIEGRENITRVAENEMRYSVKNKKIG